MKNFESFGVTEINKTEMKDINGGGFLAILIVAALGAIVHHLWKK